MAKQNNGLLGNRFLTLGAIVRVRQTEILDAPRAVAHFNATGKRPFRDIATKLTDHLDRWESEERSWNYT